MGRIKILPSILSADFAQLGHDVEMIDKGGADAVHCDIMDGHFVPNITFGPMIIAAVRKYTQLPFWTHLMLSEPEKYMEAYIKAGSNGIYIHPETGRDMERLANDIRELGAWPAIAINPDTTLNEVRKDLQYFDKILIMTVYPGFGGQSFMRKMICKIKEFHAYIQCFAKVPVIEVDGGIDENTCQEVVCAGVTSLVAGSNVFKADEPASQIQLLRERSEAVLNH